VVCCHVVTWSLTTWLPTTNVTVVVHLSGPICVSVSPVGSLK